MDYPLAPADLVTHIREGTYDLQVSDILAAIKFRVAAGEVATRWQLDFTEKFGFTIGEDSLMVGEAEDIEDLSRTNWQRLSPATSAKTARAILEVCLQTRQGKPEDEAHRLARSVTMEELVVACTEYTVERPPKGSAT